MDLINQCIRIIDNILDLISSTTFIIFIILMIFINQIIYEIYLILDFMSLIEIIITSISLIIIYNLLIIFIRDRKYAKPFKVLKDPENISLKDLKDIPIVNIIVPAWNEGEIFRQCLFSITQLKYPRLKIIVNAGGNEETISIANSFKKFNNFTIIYQEGGGKIKAINECLPHVQEGILYLVDADVYFSDETLIRLIYPLTNLNEFVSIGGHRPLQDQEDIDFVKYLYINHNLSFKVLVKRYWMLGISGANTCLKYDVIKAIGNFAESRLWPEDISRGHDIITKGFKVYSSIHPQSLLYSHEADNVKIFFKQRVRWIENSLFYAFQQKRRIYLLKFIILVLISLYILIMPFMILIHFTFFLVGIYILVNMYLKRIRRILFFKKTRPKFFNKLKFLFYFKIILYIYFEAVTNIYTLIEFIFFKNKFKKRRNL